MTTLSALREPLRAWFADLAGIDPAQVVWDGEPKGMGAAVMARLSLGRTAQVGRPNQRRTPALGGGAVDVELAAPSRFSVTMRVECRTGAKQQAVDFVEGAIARLWLDETIDALRVAGASPQRVLMSGPLSFETRDMRHESRAAIEISFGRVARMRGRTIPTVATVGVTGTVDGAPGQPRTI